MKSDSGTNIHKLARLPGELMFANRVAFERNGLVLVVISEVRHKKAKVLRLVSCQSRSVEAPSDLHLACEGEIMSVADGRAKSASSATKAMI
jgi:hypothetical protein